MASAGDLMMNFLDHRLPPSFWSKVQPCPMSGCWIWTAAIDKDGYALGAVWDRRRMQRAHRAAFEAAQHIPAGLQLDHRCRVRCCVNPAHLEPVTGRENTRRGETAAAANAAKTHCPKGHELAGSNLDAHGLRCGKRWCRACRNARQLRRYHARKVGG